MLAPDGKAPAYLRFIVEEDAAPLPREAARWLVALGPERVIHDHDPQGMRRLPLFSDARSGTTQGFSTSAIGNQSSAVMPPPLLACQDKSPPTLLGKAVHHGKTEPRSLADAFRREERLDSRRQGCFIHSLAGVSH